MPYPLGPLAGLLQGIGEGAQSAVGSLYGLQRMRQGQEEFEIRKKLLGLGLAKAEREAAEETALPSLEREFLSAVRGEAANPPSFAPASGEAGLAEFAAQRQPAQTFGQATQLLPPGGPSILLRRSPQLVATAGLKTEAAAALEQRQKRGMEEFLGHFQTAPTNQTEALTALGDMIRTANKHDLPFAKSLTETMLTTWAKDPEQSAGFLAQMVNVFNAKLAGGMKDRQQAMREAFVEAATAFPKALQSEKGRDLLKDLGLSDMFSGGKLQFQPEATQAWLGGVAVGAPSPKTVIVPESAGVAQIGGQGEPNVTPGQAPQIAPVRMLIPRPPRIREAAGQLWNLSEGGGARPLTPQPEKIVTTWGGGIFGVTPGAETTRTYREPTEGEGGAATIKTLEAQAIRFAHKLFPDDDFRATALAGDVANYLKNRPFSKPGQILGEIRRYAESAAAGLPPEKVAAIKTRVATELQKEFAASPGTPAPSRGRPGLGPKGAAAGAPDLAAKHIARDRAVEQIFGPGAAWANLTTSQKEQVSAYLIQQEAQ